MAEDCQNWMQKYAQLEDKAAYQEQYKNYYQLVQLCKAHFKNEAQTEQVDLESIRQEHHQWQSLFAKKNYLSASQNPSTIKATYQALLILNGRMNALNWEKIKVTTSNLDEQYQKEVKGWIVDCKEWLSNHGGGTLVELNALELAQAFLDAIKIAQATTSKPKLQV